MACTETRFSANFNRLGFHPGFGLSVTLLFYISGPERSMATARPKGSVRKAM